MIKTSIIAVATLAALAGASAPALASVPQSLVTGVAQTSLSSVEHTAAATAKKPVLVQKNGRWYIVETPTNAPGTIVED